MHTKKSGSKLSRISSVKKESVPKTIELRISYTLSVRQIVGLTNLVVPYYGIRKQRIPPSKMVKKVHDAVNKRAKLS